uniref:PHD finger protein 10 n=1 Tax=Aceria tosichella TaxID=561515 RepID=A0A6G1S370_9ACAR
MTDDIRRQRYIRRAVESAYEYNVFLNRSRQRIYLDMQTNTPNYPVGLGRQNKTLARTEKVGRFPVAVMPSQYQDWYIKYTPEELEYLPVDTVLKGPIMRIDQLPPVLTTPDVSDFDTSSEGSTDSDDESCSSCCSYCNNPQQE